MLYVWHTRGRREAILYAAASPIALLAWLGYAFTLSPADLAQTAGRWLGTAWGGAANAPTRFDGSLPEWLLLITLWVGPGLVVLALAGVALSRGRSPVIAHYLIAYVVTAVAVSCVMWTKEARWLIGIVPATGIAGGLLLRMREAHHPEGEDVVARIGAIHADSGEGGHRHSTEHPALGRPPMTRT